MDATSEQGRSVCESLIKDNRWVVWGLVEDKEDVIAKGGSEQDMGRNVLMNL